MAAVIGSLRAILSANIGQFTEDLGKAGKNVDSFATRAKKASAGVAKAGAAIGAALAAGATAFSFAMKKVIDDADNLSKTAKSIGTTTESLSRLRYAADLSGVSFETLTNGVARLSRNMLQASQGLQAPKRAFDALGISVTNADGTLRDSEDVINDVADRFSKMDDGAAKTAIALEIFGRAGAKMIPLLNEGSSGIKKMTDEAADLGIVIDQNTGKAAEAFNDNLNRLGRIFQSIIIKVSARLLPTLVKMSDVLVGVAKDSGALDKVASALSETFRALAATVVGAWAGIKAFGEVVGGALEAVKHFDNFEFTKGWEALKKGAADAKQTIKENTAIIDEIWAKTSRNIEASTSKVAGSGEKLKFTNQQAAAAAKKLAAEIAALRDQIDPIGAAMRVYGEKMALAQRAGLDLAQAHVVLRDEALRSAGGLDAVKDKLETLPPLLREAAEAAQQIKINEKAVEDMKRQAEEIERIGETLNRRFDPAFARDQDLSAIEAAWKSGAISAEVYEKATKDAWETFREEVRRSDKAMRDLEDIFHNVGDTLADLAISTENWKESLRDLGGRLLEIFLRSDSGLFQGGGFGNTNSARTGGFAGGTPGGGGSSSDLGGLFSSFSSFFSGFFANGGTIPAGTFGVVGERGPEMVFAGSRDMQVMPNGGGGVTQVFNISTPDPNGFRLAERQIARRAKTKLAVA